MPESTSLPQTSQKSCIALPSAYFNHARHLLQMSEQFLQMLCVANLQENLKFGNIFRSGPGVEFNNIGLIAGYQRTYIGKQVLAIICP